MECFQRFRIAGKIGSSKGSEFPWRGKIQLTVARRFYKASFFQAQKLHLTIHPFYEFIHGAADIVRHCHRSIVARSHRQAQKQFSQGNNLAFCQEHKGGLGRCIYRPGFWWQRNNIIKRNATSGDFLEHYIHHHQLCHGGMMASAFFSYKMLPVAASIKMAEPECTENSAGVTG